MSIDEKGSITNNVTKWLSSSGYRLEMDASKTLHTLGFKVRPSIYYVDPNSSKVREIDIIAEKFRRFDGVDVSIKYFIECKYSKTPWVLLSTPKSLNPNAYFSRIFKNRYDTHRWQEFDTLQGRMLASIIHFLGRDWISGSSFRLPDFTGYCLKQMGNENTKVGYKKTSNDSAYEAMNQISNCLRWFDDRSENNQIHEDYELMLNENHENNELWSDKKYLYCELGFPLIILEGPLVECSWDGAEEVVRRVDTGLVYFSPENIVEGYDAESSMSMIRIITKDYIGKYFEELNSITAEMLDCKKAILAVRDFEEQKLGNKDEKMLF